MEAVAPTTPADASARPDVVAPTGRQTAFVALGQVALMASGGLLALLIAQFFGKTTETDAFFAAYGLYTVGLVFSGTFRLTAVSRLVRAPDSTIATRLIGAVALLAGLLAIPMVLFADPVGALLVDQDPTGAAPAALRILWIAVAGQLLSAMLATILAVRGMFTAIGIVTLLSGVMSISVFLATEGRVGVDAAALGVAAGGVWLSTASLVVLWRSGWRLNLRAHGLISGVWWETRRLGYASLTFVGMNFAYVVSVAVVTRLGEGEATLYAYAYVLAGMLVAITANVPAMMRSPSMVASDERASDISGAGRWSVRFTLLVGGPVLGLAALIGPPLLAFALGGGFDEADARAIVLMMACFGGWVIASAAGIFAIVELVARSELRRLALLAIGQITAITAAAIAGASLAGAPGAALALSVVALTVTVIQMRWAYGERPSTALRWMGADALRELAVVILASGPPALLLWAIGRTLPGYVAAGLLALVLAPLASWRAWPDDVAALVGSLRQG